MREEIINLFPNSDENVVKLLIDIFASSNLKDSLLLIENELKSLTLEKAVGVSSYSSKDKTIYMDEDMLDPIVLAHEFGHFLFDHIDYSSIEYKYNEIIKKAQDNFTYHFINDDLFDSYERTVRKKMDEYFPVENKKVITQLSNLFENDNYNKIFTWLKKAKMHELHIKKMNDMENEVMEEEILNMTNNYSKEQLINYIYHNYGNNLAMKKVMKKVNTEIPGISMLLDLLSAIHDGKYYNMSFCHDSSYYKKSEDRSLDEQFANYTSLRLMNCEDALRGIRIILGDEYITFMENIYQMIIESLKNVEIKQM